MGSSTISIPSSVISPSCTKSLQQAVHTVYQIARGVLTFGISEVVIYEAVEDIKAASKIQVGAVEGEEKPKKKTFDDEDDDFINKTKAKPKKAKKANEISAEAMMVATLLQFFITPSYLRQAIFKKQTSSKKPKSKTNQDMIKSMMEYAKKLPKLPGLPFMNHSTRYREGISILSLHKSKKGNLVKNSGLTKYVNVGLKRAFQIDTSIPLNARVTVDLKEKKIVAASEAYGQDANSFGYNVRMANQFSNVFTQSSIENGYDYTVWIGSGEFHKSSTTGTADNEPTAVDMTTFSAINQEKNVLYVFGKWSDVSGAIKADAELGQVAAKDIFDGQILTKTREVRVEDSIFIGLTKALDN
ncbi:DUF171-domain-containing protein [Nadsonia fulvescens var. elongata DSM 6958]|uniref:DUF171-domain-containing protein n=1 Tax=Nadsonia fulvescens var. elongata DSM 6958 TaxID=857566 RepID=A0A1E3PTC5_9ASCO|nr:DUF171-domain-containing protein [Nadsonia fulvescens var. elongata DSM 6958]